MCKTCLKKSNMDNLLCGLCYQVVHNLPMASHPSIKDHFARVIRLVRETFCSCKFSENYVKNENQKSLGRTQDHYEKAEIHLGYCIRLPNISCKVFRNLFPRRRIERHVSEERLFI